MTASDGSIAWLEQGTSSAGFIYNTLGDVEHDFSMVVGSNGYIITAFPGL